MPQRAETGQEIEACFDVMAELRRYLDQDAFLSTVRCMESEGFRLIYIASNNKVVATNRPLRF